MTSKISMKMPVANIAMVPSINEAPNIAPVPTSYPACPVTKKMAIRGMMVSGNAVPIAANMEPTTPSESLNLRPTHSTPFVKRLLPI
jgi:hypothetical protein